MWSRVTGELARIGRETVIANALTYHNMRHVQAMYKYFEDNEVPYDVNLDYAVLYHDAVYDRHKGNESRSANLFQETYSYHNIDQPDDLNPDYVENIILATRDHVIHKDSSWQEVAIVRADLHELGIPERAEANFHDIWVESYGLYDVSYREYLIKSSQFMEKLKATVIQNRDIEDITISNFWDNIVLGIDSVIDKRNLEYKQPFDVYVQKARTMPDIEMTIDYLFDFASDEQKWKFATDILVNRYVNGKVKFI